MSEDFTFEADTSQWDELVARINAELSHPAQQRLLNDLAMRGQKITVEQMLARPHKHKAGITEKWLVQETAPDEREIYAVSPVVGYLEWGTPTPIRPTHGEFLYFENSEGQLIRKREVKGIEAQHNVDRLVLPAVEKMVFQRVDEVLERVVSG